MIFGFDFGYTFLMNNDDFDEAEVDTRYSGDVAFQRSLPYLLPFSPSPRLPAGVTLRTLVTECSMNFLVPG